MNTMVRKLAGLTLAGGLALASLSGCGLLGNAVDCASISDEMNDTVNAVGQDDFDSKVSTLRDKADGIDDADLKKAVMDFADLTEDLDKSTKDPGSSTGDVPDASKAQDMVETIQDKCQNL
ncbi:MAG TPA: hypothetical protein VE172_20530 [Stackebrandtia sp.]|jgi:hypothetical protein|uniref:hypothetical protein n=1 Tax=Stackebrandtia sp. TaxID=2023065 RepID=UPI002D2948F8|nr:hypothetical protein [Stackebrandtia sp.]HZE41193.1 hypothetical protein [Stackebrandtia sp.]